MKILIFTKNWLGEILFEMPAIQALRENFPQARLVAVSPPRCREILESLPFVDEVVSFDERKEHRSFFSKVCFVFWLRRKKFDKAFLFHRSFTRLILIWLGGVRERIGYATTKTKWLLTTAVPLPREQLHHRVDFTLVLLKWAGLKVKFGAEYQFFFRPKDERGALALLQEYNLLKKRFVVFHVGANWEPKRWPAGHFARLADLIAKNFSCPVVITGSKEDETIAREVIQKAVVAKPISLCGKTSLGVLGAFFQSAAFVVSSDSGPLHIASGVGTAVVALFGPTCPRLTGPRGVGRKVVIHHIPPGFSVPWRDEEKNLPAGGWMNQLLPEDVFKKIREENLWQGKETFSLSR